jgi:hypothetical protein
LAFHALTPDETTYEMKGVLTGTGGLTTTHTSTLYAPDHEGVQRAFAANEPVWSGGRVVRNICRSTDAFTGWTTTLCTITTGITDPDGGSTAVKVTATDSGAQFISQLPTTEFTGDRRGSIWIRRVTGTGDIKVYAGSTNFTVTIVSVTGSWQRFCADVATHTGSGSKCGVQVSTSGDEVEVWHPQMEHVAGQSDQSPGEYVENTGGSGTTAVKVFANENGNTVDGSNVVTEAVGTPLAEMPYLQYYPAATNSCLYSRDLTDASWQQNTYATYDQVGLTGESNTATLADDPESSSILFRKQSGLVISADTATYTEVVYFKKDTDQTRYPAVYLSMGGGSGPVACRGCIDTQTGYSWINYNPDASGVIEVIDLGDWWKVLVQLTNNGTKTDINPGMYPANTATLDGNEDATATGSVIVGNVEVYLNKTIAEVRGLGPIFTTTAAVSTDAVAYEVDYNNNDAFEAAWYAECSISDITTLTNGNGSIISQNQFNDNVGVMLYRGQDFGATPPVISKASVFTANDISKKLATVYSLVAGTLAINAEGSWSLDTAGFTSQAGTPKLYFMRTGTVSWMRARKLRNVKRFDIDSYADGKTIIDDLMAPPALSGTIPDLYVEDTT